MKRLPRQQKGASFIGTILVLAVLGYGVYIGIQYVPQAIEAKAINSILDNIRDSQNTDPVVNTQDAGARVIRMLQINEMNDMTDSFTVKRERGKIVIKFNYDRDLNLGYKIHPMHYEQTLSLN